MKINAEDPRLTAYALNELEPGERAAVEAELKNNPECREAVEEIRRATGLLSRELAAEPCPELSPEQRAKIDARLEPENIVALPRRNWWPAMGLAALAASVMFVVAWQLWFAGTGGEKQMARLTATPNQSQPAVTTTTPTPPSKSEPNAVVTTTVPPAVPAVSQMPPVLPTTPANVTRALVEPPNAGEMTVSAPAAEPAKAGGPAIVHTETMTTPPVTVTAPPVATPMPADLSFTYSTTHAVGDNRAPVDPATAKSGGTVTAGEAPVTMTAPQATLKNSADATGFTSQLAQNSASQQASGQAPVLQPGGGGGRGGRGGRGGAGGSGGGGGGGRRGTVMLAQNSVVVTESEYRRTTVYDDPAWNNFSQWRYYRYPAPLSVPPSTAAYPQYGENSFLPVMEHPLSTFSVDVDTASYANVRRFLNAGQLPPRDAVRIEELINYFSYNYPKPKDGDPFAATIEVAGCPWEPAHRLVRVGIKGREIAANKRPPSNFVFLIDISGSMAPRERLPLIKEALRALVKKMGEGDRVAIVVYASEAGVRLASTSCMNKEQILEAIDSLEAGGSTNGGDGIQQAYQVAQANFIAGGVNRVLLCTDGDFNVGITDQNELVRMVQERAKNGVSLTTLGVGTDNYKDALMQKLADKGNGNYHYLDSEEEAQKVLIEQMSGTLVTIAKDVKIQIEFNPARVGGYRLIGYEKRALRNEDFNNDAKDAGEIGAGHTVTALYEIAPVGGEFPGVASGLKYQDGRDAAPSAERVVAKNKQELLTLKLRYKHPDGDQSRLLEFPVTDGGASFGRASADFKFAAAVASFGMLLRDSEHKGSASYATVLELAEEAKGADESGYRSEFINLVKKAQALSAHR